MNFSRNSFTILLSFLTIILSTINGYCQERIAGERLVKTVNGVKFAFRWCPPGTFMMGSPESEEGRDESNYTPYDKEKQHKATFTKGFWMMETEVTVAQFEAFVNDTGYKSKGNTPAGLNGYTQVNGIPCSWQNPGYNQSKEYPVICVSWDDAVEFGLWLQKKLRRRVELPTEAQWEYACRAGTTTAYAENLDEMGWYVDNSEGTPHPVGMKKPNAWGLYDMHGNVWEWCADSYDQYVVDNEINPKWIPSFTVRERVCRGGSFNSEPRNCRSAQRSCSWYEKRTVGLGFRLMMAQ